jgi:hypothetical protein
VNRNPGVIGRRPLGVAAATVSTIDPARAMVDVVMRGTGERQGPVFENRDIQAMGIFQSHPKF